MGISQHKVRAIKNKPIDMKLLASSSTGCRGSITMKTYFSGLNRIEWDLQDCGPEGQHGFHVHSYDDFSDGCTSTGGHYNPTGETHGASDDVVRHVGDIPMISVNADGSSQRSSDDTEALLTGIYSVVGKPLVIHEGTDDEGQGGEDCSKSSGCAGPRIACG